MIQLILNTEYHIYHRLSSFAEHTREITDIYRLLLHGTSRLGQVKSLYIVPTTCLARVSRKRKVIVILQIIG